MGEWYLAYYTVYIELELVGNKREYKVVEKLEFLLENLLNESKVNYSKTQGIKTIIYNSSE